MKMIEKYREVYKKLIDNRDDQYLSSDIMIENLVIRKLINLKNKI